jgi:hypothetical protein
MPMGGSARIAVKVAFTSGRAALCRTTACNDSCCKSTIPLAKASVSCFSKLPIAASGLQTDECSPNLAEPVSAPEQPAPPIDLFVHRDAARC